MFPVALGAVRLDDRVGLSSKRTEASEQVIGTRRREARG